VSALVRDELGKLVEPEALVSEGELGLWRTGLGPEGVPAAVVAPSNEDQVAQLLAKASQEGWRVLPAGLGSWLRGGGPTEVTLVLSTRRLDQLQVYEPADLTVKAGAGIPMTALRDRMLPHGQWLPLDPPGSREGSLGATVTLGYGGPLRHLYGTPRDHVLGLTLVSGDGRVLRWGGQVVKNVAGFDLTRLTVGSWGTLGVVTSVSARLFPIPGTDVTLLIPGPDAEEVLPVAQAMARSPLPLASVELMAPVSSVAALEEELRAALALRLLGSQAEVAEMESRIRTELGKRAGEIRRLEGEDGRRFHEVTDGWERGRALVARLSLPPASLGRLLDEAAEMGRLASGFGLHGEAYLAAHVGAGILRVAVSELPEEESSLVAWSSHLKGIRMRTEELGGSLTLSKGPDFLMREVGAWGSDEASVHIMAGLKAQFDPAGILAPGRLGLK
jgi:glycolate oxidase FAD binding subunit